jgi:hypothetical protein
MKMKAKFLATVCQMPGTNQYIVHLVHVKGGTTSSTGQVVKVFSNADHLPTCLTAAQDFTCNFRTRPLYPTLVNQESKDKQKAFNIVYLETHNALVVAAAALIAEELRIPQKKGA